MKEAGVKGATSKGAPLTIAEARALSRSETSGEEDYPHNAMERLPEAFADLKDPTKIKDGSDFIVELQRIFCRAEGNRIGGEEVSPHTLVGICQLIHWHHDRKDVSPSRRKNLKKFIPRLLEWRDKVVSRPPSNICRFMNEVLEEFH